MHSPRPSLPPHPAHHPQAWCVSSAPWLTLLRPRSARPVTAPWLYLLSSHPRSAEGPDRQARKTRNKNQCWRSHQTFYQCWKTRRWSFPHLEPSSDYSGLSGWIHRTQNWIPKLYLVTKNRHYTYTVLAKEHDGANYKTKLYWKEEEMFIFPYL